FQSVHESDGARKTQDHGPHELGCTTPRYSQGTHRMPPSSGAHGCIRERNLESTRVARVSSRSSASGTLARVGSRQAWEPNWGTRSLPSGDAREAFPPTHSADDRGLDPPTSRVNSNVARGTESVKEVPRSRGPSKRGVRAPVSLRRVASTEVYGGRDAQRRKNHCISVNETVPRFEDSGSRRASSQGCDGESSNIESGMFSCITAVLSAGDSSARRALASIEAIASSRPFLRSGSRSSSNARSR